MNLPIFSDNLKSSASWTDLLARERESWDQARQSSEARAQIDARVRQEQLKQCLLRAGNEIDERRLNEASNLISDWSTDPEAKLDVERLLTLHRTLIGAPDDGDVLRKTEPLPISPI